MAKPGEAVGETVRLSKFEEDEPAELCGVTWLDSTRVQDLDDLSVSVVVKQIINEIDDRAVSLAELAA